MRAVKFLRRPDNDASAKRMGKVKDFHWRSERRAIGADEAKARTLQGIEVSCDDLVAVRLFVDKGFVCDRVEALDASAQEMRTGIASPITGFRYGKPMHGA